MRSLITVLVILFLMMVLSECDSLSSSPDNSTLPVADKAAIPATEGVVDVNGTTLYFKTLGEGDPIIFLHGSGGSHRYFLPFVEELAVSQQLVFYDQRGTGLSDGQFDLTEITIDQFVEDLEQLRAVQGFEKISLVGHSWGAITALAYAKKYPAHLEQLILVDPIPLERAFLAELSQTLQQRVQALEAEEREMAGSTCTERPTNLTREEVAACNAINAQLRFYDPAKALTVDTTMDENTAQNEDIIPNLIRNGFNKAQPEILASLAKLQAPTLIIHGDFDPIPVASSKSLREQIPQAELAVFSESGHFPFIEQPEEFVATIRAFLNER